MRHQRYREPRRPGSVARARRMGREPGASHADEVSEGLLHLQRVVGNAAVAHLLVGAPLPSAIQRQFEEQPEGASEPVLGEIVEITGEQANPQPAEQNEWGEIDGAMLSDVPPQAYVNGGRTGRAKVYWAGGTGGKGNQGVGSIQKLVAPVYESSPTARPGGNARAWVKPGTGKVKVIRSYIGVPGGNNSPYYITTRARNQIDRHEVKHIRSTKGIHDTHVKPLERRVSTRRGRGNALRSGATEAEAIAALQTLLDWNTGITGFANDDTTANTPGGTTDTTDSGTADFYHDYGPRTVRRVNYDHYIDTPPGP
jgi:hypothetical protein